MRWKHSRRQDLLDGTTVEADQLCVLWVSVTTGWARSIVSFIALLFQGQLVQFTVLSLLKYISGIFPAAVACQHFLLKLSQDLSDIFKFTECMAVNYSRIIQSPENTSRWNEIISLAGKPKIHTLREQKTQLKPLQEAALWPHFELLSLVIIFIFIYLKYSYFSKS